MKGTRKLLTGLLFGVLLTVVAGTSVFAATVAKIGNNKYSNLEDAFHSVKSGQTIVLQKDVKSEDYYGINLNGSFTLDLNRHTISLAHHGQIELAGGVMTLKNGTIRKTTRTGRILYVTGKGSMIKIESGTYTGSLCASDNGTLWIIGGTYKAIDTNNVALITIDNGKGIIDNGSFSAKSARMPMIENWGSLKVHGGKFSYTPKVVDDDYSDSFAPEADNGAVILTENDNAVTEISGGTFKSNSLCFDTLNGGTLNVSKGSFTSQLIGVLYSNSAKAVNLKGGTYKMVHDGWGVSYSHNCPVTITGGEYSSNWSIFENYGGGRMVIRNCKATTGNRDKYPAMVLNFGDKKSTIQITGGTFVSKGKRSYGYWRENDAGKITVGSKKIFQGTKGENKKDLFGEDR